MFYFPLEKVFKAFLLQSILLTLYPSTGLSDESQAKHSIVQWILDNRVVSFGNLSVNERGESCLGIYARQGSILTSEACLKASLNRLRQSSSNFLVTRSGKPLQISSENDFQASQGIGLVSVISNMTPADIPILTNDEPVNPGQDVTIYGYSETKHGEIDIQPYPATVSSCIENQNTCYINSPYLTSGAPVFMNGALLCIGSEVPGNCVRTSPVQHHIMKRNAAVASCHTVSEGSCKVLTCNENSPLCQQCSNGGNCTVKNGDCDGVIFGQEIICNNGGSCQLYMTYSPYSGEKCTGGICSEGACGYSCPRGCTVHPSGSVGDQMHCTYKCDLDPHLVWYILGGISASVLLLIGAGILCIGYEHYKHPNGPMPVGKMPL